MNIDYLKYRIEITSDHKQNAVLVKGDNSSNALELELVSALKKEIERQIKIYKEEKLIAVLTLNELLGKELTKVCERVINAYESGFEFRYTNTLSYQDIPVLTEHFLVESLMKSKDIGMNNKYEVLYDFVVALNENINNEDQMELFRESFIKCCERLKIEEMVNDSKQLLSGIKKVLDTILEEKNSIPLFLFIKDVVDHLEEFNK
ncbi:hypothetical protein [Priestia megaterium]|uniref:Uncharacterized protein n=1 Tax=Priestia megaterium TaxID=1404 RepID=A0A6M6E5E3_PRIMG|nr:hypothetical protein [Priestia megaterium]QJX80349.1 hypothetical protein FDZ14_30140 [Priestia megaterium]